MVPQSTSAIEIIRVDQMSRAMELEWNSLRAQRSVFGSPYFDLEFVRAVDRVRDDVEIALFRDADRKLIGALPFQRTGHSFAEPVGGRLNDLHGILGDSAEAEVYERFLDAAGLSSFSFHAMPREGNELHSFVYEQLASYFANMADGYEEYLARIREQSSTVKRHPQKSRALARQCDSLKFEFDVRDPDWLEQLIKRKRERYSRSKTFDILSVNWAADLLREVHQVQAEGFRGVLSVLRDGDQFIAGHFGMISGTILHYWFPVYDLRYSQFSPGTELYLKIARAASQHGITKIDFGYGDDPYKRRVCDGRETVQVGLVCPNRFAWEAARWKYFGRLKLKQIPMKPFVKTVLRRIYPGFGSWNFK